MKNKSKQIENNQRNIVAYVTLTILAIVAVVLIVM